MCTYLAFHRVTTLGIDPQSSRYRSVLGTIALSSRRGDGPSQARAGVSWVGIYLTLKAHRTVPPHSTRSRRLYDRQLPLYKPPLLYSVLLSHAISQFTRWLTSRFRLATTNVKCSLSTYYVPSMCSIECCLYFISPCSYHSFLPYYTIQRWCCCYRGGVSHGQIPSTFAEKVI